jgi:predicted metal-dependent hydrolase
VSDPRGHAFRGGARGPSPPRLEPQRWWRSEEYRFGCDLYNLAYWWECHEELEGLWQQEPRGSPPALLLQGLIQVAASHLKRHLGETSGARTLAALGVEKLRRAARGERRFLGLDVAAFADAVERYAVAEEPGAPWPVLVLEAAP